MFFKRLIHLERKNLEKIQKSIKVSRKCLKNFHHLHSFGVAFDCRKDLQAVGWKQRLGFIDLLILLSGKLRNTVIFLKSKTSRNLSFFTSKAKIIKIQFWPLWSVFIFDS